MTQAYWSPQTATSASSGRSTGSGWRPESSRSSPHQSSRKSAALPSKYNCAGCCAAARLLSSRTGRTRRSHLLGRAGTRDVVDAVVAHTAATGRRCCHRRSRRHRPPAGRRRGHVADHQPLISAVGIVSPWPGTQARARRATAGQCRSISRLRYPASAQPGCRTCCNPYLPPGRP